MALVLARRSPRFARAVQGRFSGADSRSLSFLEWRLAGARMLKLFAQNCKFAESARIASLKTKMLPHHMSMICTRPLGRIDNVALKRWALFTVE